MFLGVVSRYVFHKPLQWTDELSATQFIWLAMLGAVIAFRWPGHMRMTAFVSSGSLARRRYFDTFAVSVSVGFLAFILKPAIKFALEEVPITTPALQISNAWHAAALPMGIGLMLVIGVLRLLEQPGWRTTLAAVASVLVIGLASTLARPEFVGLGNYNLLIFFVLVVAALVFAGVPIAFSFGSAIFGYFVLTTRLPSLGRMDEGMRHIILLAIPLFVFLGLLIEMTGMARIIASLLGHVQGGLSFVLEGGMYLVSGISGSMTADMAAVAPVLFPEMKARGAKDGDLVALLAATQAQTETIPPSIVLITIGSVTGASISALFTGGLLPGVVLGAMLCALVWWRYRNDDMTGASRPLARLIGRAFVVAIPALLLSFVIRAAVIEGVATAAEVSTIDIAHTIAAGLLLYRQFPLDRLIPTAYQHCGAVGRHRADHRDCNGHGVGPHAIGLQHAGNDDADAAGRCAGVSSGFRNGLHRARLRAGGCSSGGAVRPADVPDRPPDRRERGALGNGGGAFDEYRLVRAPSRGRLLRRLRHQGGSRCRVTTHRRLHRGLHRGPADRHLRARHLHRIPVGGRVIIMRNQGSAS